MNVDFNQDAIRISNSYSDRHCNRGMQWIQEKYMSVKMQSETVEFLFFTQHILSPFEPPITLTKGTVRFYTSTSNKRAARQKLYTKSLTGDLKLMYSRFTLVRISINL